MIGLFGQLNGISTPLGYLMLNSVYIYIYIYIVINFLNKFFYNSDGGEKPDSIIFKKKYNTKKFHK